jgi:carboxylate-amine ligase
MNLKDYKDSFHFGLEAEFIVVNNKTFEPLWHHNLNFGQLNTILESVSLENIGSLEGLDLEPPHRKNMPYVVEGYHLTDEHFNMVSILPKGLEIRTPVCGSLNECLLNFQILHQRLQKTLKEFNYNIASLSHHPLYHHFEGKQNKRRHDYWLWAMEVMTTYGPDINISLPRALDKHLDYKKLDAKINYYGPAMAALSLASPFLNGQPWKIRGRIGKAFRTFKRSVVAPAVEYHPNENGRIEFKLFEMSWDIGDYQNYFLLFLALILDNDLKGEASQQSRVYDLGSVAQFGYEAPEIRSRLYELLNRADGVLRSWGFDPTGLESMRRRFELNLTPSDRLIQLYDESEDMGAVMQFLTQMDFSILSDITEKSVAVGTGANVGSRSNLHRCTILK